MIISQIETPNLIYIRSIVYRKKEIAKAMQVLSVRHPTFVPTTFVCPSFVETFISNQLIPFSHSLQQQLFTQHLSQQLFILSRYMESRTHARGIVIRLSSKHFFFHSQRKTIHSQKKTCAVNLITPIFAPSNHNN